MTRLSVLMLLAGRLRGRTGAAASGAHRHATQERRRSSAEARTAAIVKDLVYPPIHAVAIPDVETITLPTA